MAGENPVVKRANLIKSKKEKALKDKYGRVIIYDSRQRKLSIDGYWYSIIFDEAKGYRFIIYQGNAIRFSPVKITIRYLKDIDDLIALLQKLKESVTVKAIDYLNRSEGYTREEAEEIVL